MGGAIDDASPAEDYHELRKKGKELRYLLELFGAPLYPAEVVKPMIRTLKGLQDVLGRHQDREVQVAPLRSLAHEVARRPGGRGGADGDGGAGRAAGRGRARRAERVRRALRGVRRQGSAPARRPDVQALSPRPSAWHIEDRRRQRLRVDDAATARRSMRRKGLGQGVGDQLGARGVAG